MLSNTIFKLLWRTEQIIVLTGGASFGVNLCTLDVKWGLKKLDTSLYRVLHNIFRYTEPFGHWSPV